MAASTTDWSDDDSPVLVFDAPTPQKSQGIQQASDPADNRNSSSSSSSDSDIEIEPVVKKKRATRTVRNDAEQVSLKSKTSDCSIYTGQGYEVFKNARSISSLVQDTDDVEDGHEFIPKQTKRRRRSSGETGRSSKNRKIPKDLLDSDDEDILLLDSSPPSAERERSPTPPPDAIAGSRRARRTRMSKRGRKAVEQLTHIRSRVRMREYFSGGEMTDDRNVVSESPERRKLLVKIRTVHAIERLEMFSDDSFENVFKRMATKLDATEEQIVIYHGDYAVELFDTPGGLALTVADILDCHSVTKSDIGASAFNDSLLDDAYDPTMICLRIQAQTHGRRQDPVELKIKKKMPLEKLMRQYAKITKNDFAKLCFSFDGDVVKSTDTAESLEMEDDDCLDVACS